MRILIADDDDVSLLALEAMLRKRGHTVLTAGDGAAAWQILQEPEPPPLAILDWMMPVLDGVELCRRARDWQRQWRGRRSGRDSLLDYWDTANP